MLPEGCGCFHGRRYIQVCAQGLSWLVPAQGRGREYPSSGHGAADDSKAVPQGSAMICPMSHMESGTPLETEL